MMVVSKRVFFDLLASVYYAFFLTNQNYVFLYLEEIEGKEEALNKKEVYSFSDFAEEVFKIFGSAIINSSTEEINDVLR